MVGGNVIALGKATYIALSQAQTPLHIAFTNLLFQPSYGQRPFSLS